jgi:hypothetical protein
VGRGQLNTVRSAHDVIRLARMVGIAVAIMCTALFGFAFAHAQASPTWKIVDGRHAPDPPQDNLLFGVSCPISNSCVAVGYDGNSSFQGAFVETLSGGTWRVTPSPIAEPPYLLDSLNAVSCTSAGTCAAVGSATTMAGTNGHTLVESLRKSRWRVTSSPNTTAALNTLSGVSCASSDACVAVGDDGTPSSQSTLVETLDKGTWRLTPSPSAGSPYVVNFLNAVFCSSLTHCVAVGFAADATGMESRTLIETLSGGSWRITPSPNTTLPLNELFGVACTTSTSCVAVGDDGSISSQKTLVETLSGSTWKITPSPNTTLPLNEFFYAWCMSSTSCAAAGYAMNSSGTQAKTLIATLNGRTWTIAPTPNTTSPLNELYGYSCTSSTSCYAVGVRGTDTAQTSLIEAT